VSVSPNRLLLRLACGCLLSTTCLNAAGVAVINEFHAKPEDLHELEEFVELSNPGDQDLDVSGWKLSDAVGFTMPEGTTLPAGGYLVVAMNPAALEARYGVTALGPWSGKLNSSGEEIVLSDASGTKMDGVDYKFGFPWPSLIDGEGPSAELLNPGLDNDKGSSWRSSGTLTPAVAVPTPGARNSVYIPLNQTPPQISKVAHAPEKPTSGQDVTVTAKLFDPDGMGAVTLEYQLVEPGSYIRVTDVVYQTGWVSVAMTDDGSAGDPTADDGTYSAVLPGSLQTHRRLTRYRIRFADALGNLSLAPFADDAAANFAWFTYDGVPAWQGALRPATKVPSNPTRLATYSPATLTSVPVYTLITQNDDLLNSQYNGAYNKVRFRGTFVADGVVFDNIEFRNRGQASTYNTGKNKWRFHFNPGRDFQAYDNDGEPYSETWGSFSANANAGPWVPVHKGSLGIEEASSLKLYQLAGVPSPATHYYHFRVIRGATEAPLPGTKVSDPISTGGLIDGQYAGDFWGTFLAVERVKGGFLDSRGLPDGNIYKIEGNAGDPENLVAGQPGDSSDWNAFRNASNSSQSESWWRANMDMDTYYTFHAINRLVGNVDLRKGENHFFYRRVTTDNRWVPIPWDLDMMYLPKAHQGTSINGNFYPGVIDQHRSILENPALALEYRNRAREILDLVGSDATPSGGQIGQLLDQFSRIVSPVGTIDTLVNADAALWNLHPRANGNWNSQTGLGVTYGQDNHRGNFFRAVYVDNRFGGNWTRQLGPAGFNGVPTHTDLVNYFVNYATNTFPSAQTWAFNNGDQRGYGYETLVSESADVEVPDRPTLAYSGPTGYPRNKIAFSASAFSGANGYAATQWRLAEIAAPGVPGFDGKWKYEVTGSWSDSSAGTTVAVPAQAVVTGKTYRARARFLDATGRASHWSAPIEFVAGIASSRIAHYWDFNAAAVVDALVPVTGVGGKIETAAGANTVFTTGTGQDFVGANARYGSVAGEHFRVNNPIDAEIVFKMPTTGFEEIGMSVETRRSGSGAGTQSWSYTLDGTTFVPLGDVTVFEGAPPVIGWNFEEISGADNNPLFAVKVTFTLLGGGSSGNNRFDNLVLAGNPLPGSYAAWVDATFLPEAHLDLALSGMAGDPDGDGRSNFHEFALHTSPLVTDVPVLDFTWSLDDALRRPALAFDRPAGVTGVRYELQSSTSLAAGEWQTVATQAAESTVIGDVEHCVFRDEVNDDSAPACFLRLRIFGTP
jgi:hypothetical protein